MLKLAGREFNSHLIVGTGKYASGEQLVQACLASGAQIATMAVKRVDTEHHTDEIVKPLLEIGVQLMPNTSGAKNAREAVFAAKLAREALEVDWIKVEVHPDVKYLLPDPLETYAACKELIKDGFKVFPYIPADPVLCRRLEDLGVSAVMPLGSPIGSARGLETLGMLKIIIAESHVPVIIDAGIGCPSDAVKAFELGADACMVNTAIAAAGDKILMAKAFNLAQQAGRLAYEAGLAGQSETASPTSPLEAFLKEAMQ
ncbi:MAG: thiazole synthase [Succinivibrio sp.]|nr:thiazole synthase [Succinivibrio sp.]